MAVNLGTLRYQIGADLSGLEAALNQASSKMQGMGRRMQRVGATLTATVTAPLVALGATGLKVAGDFEQAMNKVAAVSGAAGEEFEKLKQQAEDLGRDTKFSAKEAAEGMSYLAMAGFDVNQIYGAMPTTLNLATAAGAGLGRTADIVSNIMSGFNVEASKLPGVADSLTKAFTSSNTNLQQLGTAMEYVAPTAEAMGMSINDTLSVIGKLSDAGIQGSKAGRGLRGILSTLAARSGDLGVELYNAQGQMKPFADIIDEIGAKGLNTEQIISTFGRVAAPSVQRLLSVGGDALRGFSKEMENAGGITDEVAERMLEGLNGALTELKSSFQGLAIVVADLGILEFAEDMVDALKHFVNWIADLNPLVLRTGVVFGGLVAAIGPLVGIIGTVITMMPTLSAGFAAITGPIGLAVAAFVGATGLIIANWDEISKYFISGPGQKVWEGLKDAVQGAVDFVTTIWEKGVTFISSVWDKYGDYLTAAWSDTWNLITSLLGNVFGIIGDMFSFWTSVIKGDWGNAWDAILSMFKRTANNIISVIQWLISSSINLLSEFAEKVPLVGDKISSGLDDAREWVNNFSDSLKFDMDASDVTHETERVTAGLKGAEEQAKRTAAAIQQATQSAGQSGPARPSVPVTGQKGGGDVGLPEGETIDYDAEKLNIGSFDELQRNLSSLQNSFGQAVTQEQRDAITKRMDAIKKKMAEYRGEAERTKTASTGIFGDMSEKADQVSSAISGSMSQLSTSLAQGIGAMAAGEMSFSELGSSIMTIFADLAIRVGKIVMATGSAVEAIKKALNFLQGWGAVAAGAALIAVGTWAKSAISSAAGGGGGSTGSTGGWTGGRGVSVADPSSSYPTHGAASTAASGGSMAVEVGGQFTLHGDTLVATIEETLRRRKRHGRGDGTLNVG